MLTFILFSLFFFFVSFHLAIINAVYCAILWGNDTSTGGGEDLLSLEPGLDVNAADNIVTESQRSIRVPIDEGKLR